MYHAHFGLQAAPFSIAPNPHYLYLSPSHQEALAHLLYGIQGTGGFVLLTGAIGAGKTTLCRALLDQLPAHCELAYIFNPQLNARELLASICQEFGLDTHAAAKADAATTEPSHKQLIDRLNRHLLHVHAHGKTSVLIIDEAQNLSLDVLEQLRLLTNLETTEKKLLQIILVGQPELNQLLQRPELHQLSQRIVARFHLTPLARGEIAHYIQHRLHVAGCQGNPFTANLLPQIHRLTGGVPRLINLLCDRALLGAYAQGRHQITPTLLKQAAREIALDTSSRLRRPFQLWPLIATGLLLTSLLFWVLHGTPTSLLIQPVTHPVAAIAAPPTPMASKLTPRMSFPGHAPMTAASTNRAPD